MTTPDEQDEPFITASGRVLDQAASDKLVAEAEAGYDLDALTPRPWPPGRPMTRADLHRLVDELPDDSVEPTAVLLERAKNPMFAVLQAAPPDDEPVTAEDIAALEADRRSEAASTLLADYEREHGVITDEELAEVYKTWPADDKTSD